MAQFSDPGWWQRKPPEPPKQIAMSKVVFGTLLPALAIAGIVAFIVTRHVHSHPVVRSVAAYESCVRSVRPGQGAGQRLRACGVHLPAGVRVEGGPANAEGERYTLCMQSAFAALRRAAGPAALRRASSQCQRLAAAPPGSP